MERVLTLVTANLQLVVNARRVSFYPNDKTKQSRRSRSLYFITIRLGPVLFNTHAEFRSKESSLSSRWNTEGMDVYERNNIYIAELGYTMVPN